MAAPVHRALVLFSGGQDSTVCLAWTLDRFDHVETIGFDYGQRHHIEMQCRKNVLSQIREQFPAWANKLGEDHVLDLSVLGEISDTSLTRNAAISNPTQGLPNTFVPGRNLIFFTFAAAVAYRRSIGHLVSGVCETDYSGYPDCRETTMQSLEQTLNLGMDAAFVIETPLMHIDKSATWQMAHDLGGTKLVDLVIKETHTCYIGDRSHRQPWGYGCGECPACTLRARGFEQYTNKII